MDKKTAGEKFDQLQKSWEENIRADYEKGKRRRWHAKRWALRVLVVGAGGVILYLLAKLFFA